MNIINTKELIYGGDYYPEQWLDEPEILAEDIRMMKKAGINTVTLGVFAWSFLEPEEGKYDFDWLEDVIGRLYENGISVILATPSGARPLWMAEKYEEVLRVSENGARYRFGGRHNHCFTSPIYRDKVRRIDKALAERFGSHPAVLLWHISNEFGGECFCPLCQDAFRGWLRQRYGTIEKVNKSWWTAFWSHRYDSFEQIAAPGPTGETGIHGLNLAWRRFVTDQTIDFMKEEIRAIRDGGARQSVTTNLMYDFGGLNYGKLSKYIDVVSWDNYPAWHKGRLEDVAMDSGMQHDYMRSLKHQPFLMMESCTTATNWQGVSKLKDPGLLLNQSLQAIAHGADSAQYFQIRQSRGSSEKFHGAVIDHYGGDDTRVFREVEKTGRLLALLKEAAGTEVKAEAAVLYDVENRWAMEDSQGPRNNGLYYHEAAMKSYTALRRYGINVDVIDMDQELDGYRVVAAPMLYMFRGGIEEKLREFVRKGGTLIMTYWSGIVDEDDLCFPGEVPHALTDVLGLRSEEIDGLYDGVTNTAVRADHGSAGPERGDTPPEDLPAQASDAAVTETMRQEYTCSRLCDLTDVRTAEVLMTYGSDFYAGKAALTWNSFGDGEAYYVCADMEQSFYTDLYEKILARRGIRRILENVPACAEVSSRVSDDKEYIFVQNYSRGPVPVELPEDAVILTEDALMEDAFTEDALMEDALTEDALMEDALTDDALTKDALTETIPADGAGDRVIRRQMRPLSTLVLVRSLSIA